MHSSGILKVGWKTRSTGKACMVSTLSKEELMAIACSQRIYKDKWTNEVKRTHEGRGLLKDL